MLNKIRGLLDGHTDRQAFFTITGRFFPKYGEEYKLIEKAYNVAKREFREKYRESGERYFEHLRGVALILILYLRVRDANIIVAALLHDIVEDIPGWNQDRLASEFNPVVALLVWWVTKPSLELFNGDKEARNRVYHTNLSNAPHKSILIKLADRLHNMIMLWACQEEKQRRKVRETQDFYLPLAEKHTLLIHELEFALEEIMNAWKVKSDAVTV